MKCHQAAYGAGPEQTASSYRPEEGVGCEGCHGPGSAYAEEDHGPDVPNREAMGFRVLRNLSDRREVCTSCHNRASPTFIGFDLREFSRKIAHWVDEEDAAYYAEYDKEAARRAIIRCSRDGYQLPPDKYAHWRDIEMTFNPERMRLK